MVLRIILNGFLNKPTAPAVLGTGARYFKVKILNCMLFILAENIPENNVLTHC